MSEEIKKNQPGEGGELGGTAPGLYQGQGAVANLGIGGVDGVPGGDAWGTPGNIPNAEYGLTTGPNAVNPTGVPGGILNPEQARRFIDYVWDATILAQDGRRVTMRANTMELEKVNVGERVIRAATQAEGSYTNAGATFSKVELTTKKIRLDWHSPTILKILLLTALVTLVMEHSSELWKVSSARQPMATHTKHSLQ
jgi:hypothetical protein